MNCCLLLDSFGASKHSSVAGWNFTQRLARCCSAPIHRWTAGQRRNRWWLLLWHTNMYFVIVAATAQFWLVQPKFGSINNLIYNRQLSTAAEAAVFKICLLNFAKLQKHPTNLRERQTEQVCKLCTQIIWCESGAHNGKRIRSAQR